MEKVEFKAEVDRMMKLIINSLYKNKEVSIGYLLLDFITQIKERLLMDFIIPH